MLIADLRLHQSAINWLDSIPKQADSKPRVVFHKTDVTDWKQLEELFDVYAKEFGGTPFVVCPGAGLYEPVSELSPPLPFHQPVPCPAMYNYNVILTLLSFSPQMDSGTRKIQTTTTSSSQ